MSKIIFYILTVFIILIIINSLLFQQANAQSYNIKTIYLGQYDYGVNPLGLSNVTNTIYFGEGNPTIEGANTITGSTFTLSVSGMRGDVLSISPNGGTLYAITTNSLIPINTLQNTIGSLIPVNSVGGMTDAIVSPNGNTVYASTGFGCCASEYVYPYNLVTSTAGNAIQITNYGSSLSPLAISPSGNTLYVAGNPGKIYVVNLVTGTISNTISVPFNKQVLFTLSPNGNVLYAYGTPSLLGNVIPINTISYALGTPISTETGTNTMSGIFSPNGKIFYAGEANGNIVPVDTSTYALDTPIFTATNSILSLNMSPNGQILYAGGSKQVFVITFYPSISPSSSEAFDYGQSITFSSSWTGGTAPYTANWLIDNSITGTQLANSLYTGISSTSNSFTWAFPSSDVGNTVQGNVTITDSSTPKDTSNSLKSAVLTLNPSLGASLLTSSPNLPSTQNAGNTITFTASWSGGTSPYTINYIITNTVTGALIANMLFTNIASTSNSFEWTIPQADIGNTVQANVIVTDSASTPETTNSAESGILTITYHLLSLPVLSSCPSAVIVDVGQSVSCTATVSGGTSPYTYNWLVVNSITDAVVANMLFTGVSSTSNAFTYATQNANTANSPLAFNVIVTDSHPTTVNSAYSSTFTVNPALVAGAITPSSPTIDSGQSITLTANPSGGTTDTVVPLHLTYNTLAVYPNPFQQMITINALNYTNYLSYNGNTANFELTYSNDTVIPSWIESNDSNTITLWAKVSNTIFSTGSNTIYLDFVSKSINLLLNSGTSGIGEAPQLSPSYAEYDDGASVFNFYDNFVGTTLNTSKWNNYASSGVTGNTENINVYNGLTLSKGTSEYNTYISSSAQTLTTNTIIDIYWTPATSYGSQVGYISQLGYDLYNIQGAGVQYWQGGYYVDSRASALSQTQFGSYSLQNYLSSISISTTAVKGYLNDYVLTGSITTNLNTIPPSNPLYLEIAQDSSTYNTLVTWVRTRAYPPNGVMPSVSFGPSSSGVYSYQWYSGTSSTCLSDTVISGSISSTYSASPTSSTYYCYKVTDRATTPVTQLSSNDLVLVNGAIGTPSLTASNTPTVDTGQYEAFSSSWTGGTLPYTANYLVFNTVTDALVANALYTGITGTSNTFLWLVPTADAGNTISANIFLTDSASNPITVNSIQLSSITISQPTTTSTTSTSTTSTSTSTSTTSTSTSTSTTSTSTSTSTTSTSTSTSITSTSTSTSTTSTPSTTLTTTAAPSGSGGGSGSGGVIIHPPSTSVSSISTSSTTSTSTSTSSTSSSSTSSTTASTSSTSTSTASTSSIKPSTTITPIVVSKSVTVSKTSAGKVNFTAYNISVGVSTLSKKQRNVTISIYKPTNLNVTPDNYSNIFSFQLNASSANVNMNITIGYNCQYGTNVAPFVFENNTWNQIYNYVILQDPCRITFPAPDGHTIGLFRYSPIIQSTTMSTSIAATTAIKNYTYASPYPYYYFAIAIVVLLILIAYLLIRNRNKQK